MSKEDFSQYGKDFQESLCHLMLIDRPFADQMYEVIDINFLELKYLQTFVKLVQNYREKFGVHPSEDIMKTVIIFITFSNYIYVSVMHSKPFECRWYFIKIIIPSIISMV